MRKLKNFTRKIIGSKNYTNIKKAYKNLWKKFHKKLSFDKFADILKNNLKIEPGATIFVHSSVTDLNIDFPFFKIIPLLKELVGKEGTIVFPTHQINGNLEEYLENHDAIFDVKKTPTVLGILPEIMRRDKNAVRSLHPTNSVVAYGKYAKEITKDHISSIYPCGEKSPLYKITQFDGIIIGLGVDTRYLTFVHTIEDIMKDDFPIPPSSKKRYKCKVRDYDGNLITVDTLMNYKKDIRPKINKYIKKYIPKEVCYGFKVNGNKFYYCNSSSLLDKMKELAKKNITIYKW